MERGRFITFEGGEACGKSTQIARLRSRLEKVGVRVMLTREPGGTWLAERIRELIKDQTEEAPCDRTELLLFLAARAQLVRNVIRPALFRGEWVLSDRFSDSTLAYQGYGRGLSLDVIRAINSFACEDLTPDLTLLLEVAPDVAAARRRNREAATATIADRIESAGEGFHVRLHAGFEELARAEPERIRRIDAVGSIDEVETRVWTSVRHLI